MAGRRIARRIETQGGLTPRLLFRDKISGSSAENIIDPITPAASRDPGSFQQPPFGPPELHSIHPHKMRVGRLRWR